LLGHEHGQWGGTQSSSDTPRWMTSTSARESTCCSTSCSGATPVIDVPSGATLASKCPSLRTNPCSPTCADWLRYRIQPPSAHARSCVPATARARRTTGKRWAFGGRRVLIPREWSGKALADHKPDQREWVLTTLGISATDEAA